MRVWKILTATAMTALALTAAVPAPAHAAVTGHGATTLAACHYSTDPNQSAFINPYLLLGFGYAGHYNGLTVVPSSTGVTEAGIEAQCLLTRYGQYNPGPIDGVFGANSKAAMRRFQSDMNAHGAHLTVDGLPGPQSWPWLRYAEQ